MAGEMSRDELNKLAAQVINRILSDESLSDALAERVARAAECPSHTLCCSKNHVCPNGLFSCPAPFHCESGHEEKL
jgi:hypothetical protein